MRPGRTGYEPWPQMAVASAALGCLACRGAYMARTLVNAVAIFAGTSSRLYKFASMASWTDFSKGAANYTALPTDDLWQFAQYGPNVYATNIGNPLQSCDVSSGTVFADVAGSPPKAKYLAVVGDFLMLGNTETSSREVRWSARNDPTSWTRYVKDADCQAFPDGGDVMGLSGFEQGGLIFQTEVVRHMQVRPDAAIMEFHRVEASQGTLAPYSHHHAPGRCLLLRDKRISADYRQMAPAEGIGANWIDDWFLDNSLAASRPKAIVGSVIVALAADHSGSLRAHQMTAHLRSSITRCALIRH